MRWLNWSLLGLQVVALSACHAAPSLAPAVARQPMRAAARAAETDLYPVTAGSKWTYVLHQRQANGEVQDKPMTIAITESKARPDGAIEAVTVRRYESWSPPPTRVLRFPDRVVLSRLSDPEDGPSITVLRLPLEPGASWPGRPLGGGHQEVIRAVGRETITVDAGRFEAQRVDHDITYANGGTDKLQYWYAPGVGVVKMIERTTLYQGDTPLHLEVVGELTGYQIGPAESGMAARALLSSPGSAAK